MEQRFITTGQAGLIGQLSVEGVKYAIKTGRLTPDARTERGAALFLRETVERWAKARREAK
jgi:hypothetical protein